VVAISTLVPYDEYLASRFHKEWAQPQGYVDSINACLEKTRGSFATFTIARDEAHGVADETAFQRMNLLVPHLRRAVAVGNSLRQHRVQAAQLADTLDGIEASVFILDSGRQVMHANAASKQLTDAGAIVRVNSNQLSALDPAADRLLAEAVAAAEAGDLSIAAKGVSIPLASKGGDHWIAHVLPLTSGQRRRAGAAYSAVAALFIRKASFEISNPVETAARLYKLTEAELRVLFALVASDGIADAANVLGLSQSTVRTHLQSIFRKTNTTRQSALVRLVAALSNPVIS
jgi:DNA-binding CsgD family transcriptional regulator